MKLCLNSKTLGEFKIVVTTSEEYTIEAGKSEAFKVPTPSEKDYRIISKLYSYSNGTVIYVNPNGWAHNFLDSIKTCTFSTAWLLYKR